MQLTEVPKDPPTIRYVALISFSLQILYEANHEQNEQNVKDRSTNDQNTIRYSHYLCRT